MMASMRNGTGDEYFILFNKDETILKGCDHESEMNFDITDSNKTEFFRDVPSEFANFLTEPAFAIENATFLLWKRYSDADWKIEINKLEKAEATIKNLLFVLDGKPSTYKEFAEDYYEKEFSLKAVEHIYNHQPLTHKIIHSLNSEITLEDLEEDIGEIGYPVESSR